MQQDRITCDTRRHLHHLGIGDIFFYIVHMFRVLQSWLMTYLSKLQLNCIFSPARGHPFRLVEAELLAADDCWAEDDARGGSPFSRIALVTVGYFRMQGFSRPSRWSTARLAVCWCAGDPPALL